MSSAINKTPGQTLLAWQDVASAACIVGTALDVSTELAANVFVFLGRQTGSAFTTGSPSIRIEASAKSSGNDAWIPICSFTPAVGASIANTTANGAISAGATSCVVTSASNIAAGDLLFLGHTSDTTKYELCRVKSVASTTVTFEEACTNAHDSGCEISDQSEVYPAQLDLTAIPRIRAVCDNIGSGQGIYVQVLVVTGDSVG